MNNIDQFNIIAGKLFADLYSTFPEYREIDYFSLSLDLIPKEEFDKGFDIPQFTEATVRWLSDAGYIWLLPPEHLCGKPKAVLSPKGLEVLKSNPSSLEGKKPLGEKLIEFTKNRLTDALSQAVSIGITQGFKLMTNAS